MPDPSVQKVELTIPINETDLLRMLLSRYNQEELERANILPENSIIRGFTTSSDGKCEFRVCSMSLVDVEAMIEGLASRETSEQEGESHCGVREDGYPGGGGIEDESGPELLRVKKARKGSN